MRTVFTFSFLLLFGIYFLHLLAENSGCLSWGETTPSASIESYQHLQHFSLCPFVTNWKKSAKVGLCCSITCYMCDVSRDLPTPCVCWSAETVRASSPDSPSIYNCLGIFYLGSLKHTSLPWFPPTFVGLDIVRFLYQTRWQTQAANCLNYHLFTKFRIGLSGLPLSAWQHDNWTSAACRHALYVTTSGISSGRQIPRWQGSFLPPKWPAVHGSFLVKNQSFHLIDQKDDKVQC